MCVCVCVLGKYSGRCVCACVCVSWVSTQADVCVCVCVCVECVLLTVCLCSTHRVYVSECVLLTLRSFSCISRTFASLCSIQRERVRRAAARVGI